MNYSKLCGLMACFAVVSLASCQDEDFGYSTSEIKSAKYAKDFRNFFGDIDPEQDWNLATRGTVSVTAAPGSEIKVYAKMDGTYKIVGDYENFSGNETLNFDMLEETIDILVSDGMQSAYAKVGDAVNLSGTRAGHYGTTGNMTVSKITDPNQWFVFDRAEAEKYQEKLPEGVNNLGKVTQNFTFISNGEFTVYPIYWQTSNTDEIGVYYTDASGYYEVPVYTIKSGDELQYTSTNASTYFDYCYASDGWGNDQSKVGHECAGCSNGGIVTKVDESGRAFHTKTTAAVWSNVSASPTSDHLKWGAEFERSKGVKVSIPAGTLFGMYIKPSNGIKQYSQQEKNSTIYSSGSTKDVWAATFTLPSTANSAEDDMYLCFEDWQTSGCDKDLNDVVFRFYGTTPTVVDEDAQEWVICGEDLGGTFDLDYNDVVVSIAHVAGKTTADFTALAAGGTLASYVYFGGTCLGEIHELLGAQNVKSGDYSPINVSGTVGKTAQRTLSVASNFSIATVADGDLIDENMGGFQIRVVPLGEASTSSNAVNKGQKIQNSWVTTSQNVPYVFCVPRSWEDHGVKKSFRWPNELQPVDDYNGKQGAYDVGNNGHNFSNWISKKDKNQWFKSPVNNLTTGF